MKWQLSTTLVLGWGASLGLHCFWLAGGANLAAQSPTLQQPESSPSAPASSARELPRVRSAFTGTRDPSKEVLILIEPDGAILHGGKVMVAATEAEPEALKEAYMAILRTARQAKGRTIESRKVDGMTPIDVVVDPVRLQAAPNTPWERVKPLFLACVRTELAFIHVDFAVVLGGSAASGGESTHRYAIPVGHEHEPPPADPRTKDTPPPQVDSVELVLAGKQAAADPAAGKPAPTLADLAAPGFVPQWTIRLTPDPLQRPQLRRSLEGSALGRLPATLDTLDDVVKQLEILAKDPKANVTWNDRGPRLLPVILQPAANAPLELVLQSREAVFAAGFKSAQF